MAFIPLMISSKNFYEIDAALKYFLIQAFAAAIFLLGALLSVIQIFSSVYVIIISLALKIGAAPFHS